MATETLGSLNNFALEVGKSPQEALQDYTVALASMRRQLAEKLMITTVELHEQNAYQLNEDQK